ncbi:LysM peptidoglycan-binding domain-containing protein [Anaerocolumna sedimenticola]|uniref:LysM peptidoglycan-binding domain-containing protein n=1 Tax=Anaerocolumna sedimenticola TaxID=2696063 RepID=A0A6P1TMV9_9FIRM|nr:LysM peptidoglycan-binding domain-containing protein [Anaerocolumna sedimenticola]QHQ61813.1 LysM peptidoglycan-binding domain-containing protein [Anaerocolumna sedimenticola]
MDIYVVQQDDNISKIAARYGITIERIVKDNGLEYPFNLAIGQALIITFPKQSHIVQEGDTVQSIADSYNVTIMQILRNNPYLTIREPLIGETLVISYYTSGSIATNGFSFPYIRIETLVQTLPNLTYLSIFNYTVAEGGQIISYYDDSEIIRTSKDYGVIPLMLLTTLTPQGVPNIEIAFNILLNEEYQERLINEFIDIMKQQGYQGINIVFNFINENNQSLYQNFVQKISNRLQQENFLFFITINYNVQIIDNKISVEQVNFSILSNYVNGIIFLNIIWGANVNPPAPVSNINYLRELMNHVIFSTPNKKVSIGMPILGYDWQLPFIPNVTKANSLTMESAINLAYDTGSIIQFDEDSQTPYFYYNDFSFGYPYQHIVWFIDARSIHVLNQLIDEHGLSGSGIWNIMIYNQQLWTLICASYDVVKLI